MYPVPQFLQPALNPLRNILLGKNTLPRAIRALEIRAAPRRTFNEKVLYKMAFDRRPILTTFADKIAVRDYVISRNCQKYLPYRFATYSHLPEGPPVNLPKEYVIKASHGSGGAVILWDGAGETTIPTDLRRIHWDSFVVRPDSLNWEDLQRLTEKWMNQTLYWSYGRYPEWAYKDVPPRIIFEELLTDSSGKPCGDYKFFMFDGKCRMIHQDSQRFTDHLRDVFDPQWNLLPFTIKFRNSQNPAPKPDTLEEMIELAERLSAGMDFVRVDLYDTRDGVRFGEITNYPAGGTQRFDPHYFDEWLGNYWQIPDYTSVNGVREVH